MKPASSGWPRCSSARATSLKRGYGAATPAAARRKAIWRWHPLRPNAAASDSPARRRPQAVPRADLCLCRGEGSGAGDRRHHPRRNAKAVQARNGSGQDHRCRGCHRRHDQRLAVRLCRRRDEWTQGVAADVARQPGESLRFLTRAAPGVDRLGQDAVAGIGPVEGSRPRPRGRRKRQPDRGIRPRRLAPLHPP